MPKPLSDTLYDFERDGVPSPALERCSARDLGLAESWFRDAIFEAPELVIGPCRAAGVTEDNWYSWAREYPVEVGSIDVLLLSSEGRVAIVETKLATNPEIRRRVLAQALDYLAHLPAALDESPPAIPADSQGAPVADIEDIRQSVERGDILIIIVSDEADPRVTRLSRSLIGDNLVREWDLVLIDLALFRPVRAEAGSFVIVPHVRSSVLGELRQVVRVMVQGETPSTRVKVERVEPGTAESGGRKWDEAQFFQSLKGGNVPAAVQELASKLRALAAKFPQSVSLAWGRGRYGSMVFKRADQGLIEIHGQGQIRFRPPKFAGALGKKVASKYQRALEQLAPGAMKMDYPILQSSEAALVAPQLYDLLEQVLHDPDLEVE